jgi:PEP-CTERM motif
MVTGKWGVFSLILGVFAAIPIAASATDIVVQPLPAEYRVGIPGVIDGWSDKPIRYVDDGGKYLVSTFADASGQVGVFAVIYDLQPTDDALGFNNIQAELRYYFALIGPDFGAQVPVIVKDSSESGPQSVAFGTSDPNAETGIAFSITGPGVNLSGNACVNTISPCSSTGIPAVWNFNVTVGDIYEIDMLADIQNIFSGCVDCAIAAAAGADPYIGVDPSFPDANAYSVIVSAGVANVPLTVPEPSTWAMTLLGFAGLGCAGWRARRKTAGAAA